MKLKGLVGKKVPDEFNGFSKSGLETSDTVFQAVAHFSKYRTPELAVYENGELEGSISLLRVTQAIVQEYNSEIDRRFKLVVKLNAKVIKLQHLLKAISTTRKPNEYLKETIEGTLKEIIEILSTKG